MVNEYNLEETAEWKHGSFNKCSIMSNIFPYYNTFKKNDTDKKSYFVLPMHIEFHVF